MHNAIELTKEIVKQLNKLNKDIELLIDNVEDGYKMNTIDQYENIDLYNLHEAFKGRLKYSKEKIKSIFDETKEILEETCISYEARKYSKKLQEEFKELEFEESPTEEDPALVKVFFGEFRGKTLGEIWNENPSFVSDWLATDMFDPKTDEAIYLKDAAIKFLNKEGFRRD